MNAQELLAVANLGVELVRQRDALDRVAALKRSAPTCLAEWEDPENGSAPCYVRRRRDHRCGPCRLHGSYRIQLDELLQNIETIHWSIRKIAGPEL